MKKEINDNDLEKVCGGSVIVDNTHNTVTFSTLKKTFYLSCSAKRVSVFVRDMQKSNVLLAKDEEAFENKILVELDRRGWLSI